MKSPKTSRYCRKCDSRRYCIENRSKCIEKIEYEENTVFVASFIFMMGMLILMFLLICLAGGV